MQAGDVLGSGFGPGALIEGTDGSEIPVEWLSIGDEVMTRDHGLQPVRWIGRTRVPLNLVATDPAHMPIALRTSTGPLLLAPGHRVLLEGAALELHFGLDAAFGAARDLDDRAASPPSFDGSIEYTHFLLDRHEVIRVNGLWVESGFADDLLARFPDASAAATLSGRPALGRIAHPCLASWEVMFLKQQEVRTKTRKLGAAA